MSTPRRRVLRPIPPAVPVDLQVQRRLQQLRAKLEQEQAGLARWMGKLRRAFHAVERHQVRVARLERQVTQTSP